MIRQISQWVLFTLILGILLGVAQAQYRPAPSRGEPAAQPEEEEFDRAVDLKRFRRGNFEWDTQELIASGFTALHREHTKILKELEALRAEVTRLKSKQ